MLAHGRDLGPDRIDEIANLRLGEKAGVFLWQLQQGFLPQRDNIRQFPHQLRHLVRQARHQPEQSKYQKRHEQNEYQRHRGYSRRTQLVGFLHSPVQQVGNDDTREHRRQHLSKGQNDDEDDDQGHPENDHLGIRDVMLVPFAQNIHAVNPCSLTSVVRSAL